MSISFRCHVCDTPYTVNDLSAGKRIECKVCMAEMVVQSGRSVPSHIARSVVEPAKPNVEIERPRESRSEQVKAVPVRNRHDDDDDDDSPRERRPSRKKRWRFECPYCGCTDYPERVTKISTAGWIVAVILLVTTCVFFFIGLMITETKSHCRNCGVRIGG